MISAVYFMENEFEPSDIDSGTTLRLPRDYSIKEYFYFFSSTK